ncbi:MAG: SAM-dependent methyltransferase [Lishizhenia sp.]
MTSNELFRLDKLVVDQELTSNRTEAEQLIKTYGVLVNGKLVNKPGKKFSSSIQIEKVVVNDTAISVRSVILQKALATFSIAVQNKVALDIGAGKGGFTHVLLNSDIKKVYAVDKEEHLLSFHLRTDKVIDLQKTHVRELTSAIINEEIDFCAVDVDNIQTNEVIPFIHAFLKPQSSVIVVIKPQFELPKKEVQKGVVKNVKLFPALIEHVKQQAALSNLIFQDYIESPILGNNGNREFIMHFKKA